MRTNIDIDDQLIREAMEKSGAPTKKAAVEAALRLLLDVYSQADIQLLYGKMQWKCDLNESRLGRASSQKR